MIISNAQSVRNDFNFLSDRDGTALGIEIKPTLCQSTRLPEYLETKLLTRELSFKSAEGSNLLLQFSPVSVDQACVLTETWKPTLVIFFSSDTMNDSALEVRNYYQSINVAQVKLNSTFPF